MSHIVDKQGFTSWSWKRTKFYISAAYCRRCLNAVLYSPKLDETIYDDEDALEDTIYNDIERETNQNLLREGLIAPFIV